jgi:hypothetical protein
MAWWVTAGPGGTGSMLHAYLDNTGITGDGVSNTGDSRHLTFTHVRSGKEHILQLSGRIYNWTVLPWVQGCRSFTL